MLNCLQNSLNFSEMKVVPKYETILLGSLPSEKIIFHVFVRLSVLNFFITVSQAETCCGNLQYKDTTFY